MGSMASKTERSLYSRENDHLKIFYSDKKDSRIYFGKYTT